MKVGDLVLTTTKEIGIVVSASSTHCAVFIHKNRTLKKNMTFRIHKDFLEAL